MSETQSDHSKMSAAQDEVIVAALAIGMSHELAGQRAGRSAKTVQRRLRDPEFQAKVDALRSDHVDAVCGGLVALSGDALRVIDECMRDIDLKVRLRAAEIALRYMLPYRRLEDLQRRVAEATKLDDGEASS